MTAEAHIWSWRTTVHRTSPARTSPRRAAIFAAGAWRGEDLISEWRLEEEYRPSAWAHTDYNFETPSTSLMVTVKDDGKYEIYDYPGFYIKKATEITLAKTRLQETVAFKNRVTGKVQLPAISQRAPPWK